MRYTNIVPAKLPIIPKDAKFRLWAYDWITPDGRRWDHRGNQLPDSFLSTHAKRSGGIT